LTSSFPSVPVARDLGPQRTLLLRTSKQTYGFRYSGLLHWSGTDARLEIQFTTATVVVHGKELLRLYATKLADDRVVEFVEPTRADKFRTEKTGSTGVERVEVVWVEK